MFPEVPRLAICPQCGDFIWLAKIPINEAETSKVHRHQRVQIRSYAELNEDDFQRALLSVSNESYDDLLYILTQLWWYSNDQTRENPAINHTDFTETQRRNMAILFGMLKVGNDRDRLIKAEIARELGWFDEASKLLRDEFPTNLKIAAAKIKDLIRRRLTRVVMLQ